MNDIQEKPVEASHHISINHPVSQSYIYQTPSTKCQYSIENRARTPNKTPTLRLSYCLVRGHLLPTTAWGRSLAATRPTTLRLSYCLVCGHLLPTTAWGRSLAATRPATLRLSYCLVRDHLLATSAWMFSRSYIIRQLLACWVPVNDIGGF